MIITVHAKAHARKNEVSKLDENTFKISVTETAEKGKANEAILKSLAEHLKISTSRISLIRGRTIPLKQFEII